MTALQAAYLLGIILLITLTVLAYWKGNPAVFMIVAGISLMVGLYSPDALGPLDYSGFGVSIGLMLIFYSFVSVGFAYANLFKKNPEAEEDD